jgi:FkbM family methyltransferase
MSTRTLANRLPVMALAVLGILLLTHYHLSMISSLGGSFSSNEASHLLRTISPPALFTPKTQAHRCRGVDETASEFHSQSGEDKYLIENFFKNVCGGSYIEMGALDGQKYSNSFYFNKARDWKGLLVEANPMNYARLIENRQNELVTPVHAAVCDKEQDVHWISAGAMGGIVEFAPEGFKKQWWNGKMIENAVVIKCLPLNQIISDANITTDGHAFFDFYSLDVEGGEYDVLRAINFDTLAFGVIFYETDEYNTVKNSVVRTLLESKGYPFVAHYQRSNWHININFHSIYHNIVHDN